MPAEFGPLSQADVAVIAGAVRTHENFIVTVLHESGGEGLSLSAEMLGELCHGEESIVALASLDAQFQNGAAQKIRGAAFKKVSQILPSEIDGAIAAKSPAVASLLRDIQGARALSVEIMDEKGNTTSVSGIEAIVSLADINVQRNGVKIRRQGQPDVVVTMVLDKQKSQETETPVYQIVVQR
jgi:hypothetical protein